MVFEMRTYSFHPGALPTYLHLAQVLGRPVRGNDYGICCGYWIAQTGRLDQVWHLWSYDSLDERARLRAILLKDDRWTKEYGGAVLPLLQRQDIRLLEPARALSAPEPGGLFELRLHRARPGHSRPWLDEALPPGQDDAAPSAHTVGLWTGISPQPNEVVQLRSFRSCDDWLRERAAQQLPSADGPSPQAPDSRLAEVESILLKPTLFSPMQ